MKRSVKQFSQEFKLKVVLGSMREGLTTNQIAAKYISR
jgi:transposase-like protein